MQQLRSGNLKDLNPKGEASLLNNMIENLAKLKHILAKFQD